MQQSDSHEAKVRALSVAGLLTAIPAGLVVGALVGPNAGIPMIVGGMVVFAVASDQPKK